MGRKKKQMILKLELDEYIENGNKKRYGEVEEDEIFSQYIECIRRLLARLVLESYDVAAYVYQKYCVERISLEEMMKTTRLTESALNMFVKYFDAREK